MKALLIMILSMISFSALAKPAQTFAVVREQCLLFPKLPDIEKMVIGIHYESKRDTTAYCETDDRGDYEYEKCEDIISVIFNYRFTEIKTIDHYTADGKLFTTSYEKVSDEMKEPTEAPTIGEWLYSSSGPVPSDESAKGLFRELHAEAEYGLQKKIAKKIYESDYGACKDSYYK